MPDCTVVVVTWDGRDLLRGCLEALAEQSEPHDVVVVDNGSQDGTLELPALAAENLRVVPLPENVGFATGANTGAAAVSTPWVVFLNNDARPRPGWLEALMAAARQAPEDVVFLASKILLDDDVIDSAGDELDRSFTAQPRGHGRTDNGSFDDAGPMVSACGGAAAFRTSAWRDLGGFEDAFFAYFEDADLCLRAQLRGWRGLLVAEAVCGHQLSATSGRMPGFKRYQGVRNSWYLFIRCVPRPLLARALPRFLVTQAVWAAAAVRHSEAGPLLRAYRDLARRLPALLRQRRDVQAHNVVPPLSLWQALPPSRELARWRR